MNRIIVVLLSVLFVCSGCSKKADEQKTVQEQPAMEQSATETDFAYCAVDGMKMKKSVMVQVDYNNKTYYVCSASEKEEFLKDPEKYSKIEHKEETHPDNK
jgi:YHS domain-containing protein